MICVWSSRFPFPRDCPQCKVKRKATKQLSLARLPPILLIHLKRFEANGRFSDKIDTFVDYPMKTLDLTGFMPPPLPPGADKGPDNVPMSPDDPRSQMPPYKYDLYGVTNHIGNLSSGHCTSFIMSLSKWSCSSLPTDTAFVASRGGWLYCDDSSVKSVDPKQVVVCDDHIVQQLMLTSQTGSTSLCPILQKDKSMNILNTVISPIYSYYFLQFKPCYHL